MKINLKTMVLFDLTDAEAQELLDISERIILNGDLDIEHPYIQWYLKMTGVATDHNLMILASTVIPQKFLLSYIYHKKS